MRNDRQRLFPSWIRVVIKITVIAWLGIASTLHADHPSARGEYPSYLLLRTPAASTHHKPTHGYYPGYGYPVETQSFSYGWFGVQPRSHWSRHFGYNRNYTEWSRK